VEEEEEVVEGFLCFVTAHEQWVLVYFAGSLGLAFHLMEKGFVLSRGLPHLKPLVVKSRHPARVSRV
jgi:hypothetical protein